jgi:hypothetical protein
MCKLEWRGRHSSKLILSPGDGGGGDFYAIGTGCAPDVAILIADNASPKNCFKRSTFPTDVRQWGAKCDVQYESSEGTWDNTNNWIKLHSVNLRNPPTGGTQLYLTATQIGNPPIWADRWSKVTSPSGSAYHTGDLIAFIGSNSANLGVFTQQVSVVVDQVSNGQINKWHFVSGDQYSSVPDTTSPMTVDIPHSCIAPIINGVCKGTDTSAQLMPAWSGWSVLDWNNGTTLATAGTGVSLGQQIQFDFQTTGGSVNQGHYPTIVVTQINGSGGVQAWQWVDYGSYNTIPPSVGGISPPLVQLICNVGATCPPCTSTSCTPCTGPTAYVTLAPEWTRGTLASAAIVKDSMNGCQNNFTCVRPLSVPSGVQDGQPIEGLYIGDNDGAKISAAVGSPLNTSIIRISGFCGTTTPIIIPDTTTRNSNLNSTTATLVGTNYKTSGLFAFAIDNHAGSSTRPMNHLLYGGAALSFGGGLRDLEIEGMGVPQGFGYYSNASFTGAMPPDPSPPTGYNGPMYSGPSLPCVVVKATMTARLQLASAPLREVPWSK